MSKHRQQYRAETVLRRQQAQCNHTILGALGTLSEWGARRMVLIEAFFDEPRRSVVQEGERPVESIVFGSS